MAANIPSILTTPAQLPEQGPRLMTNLDTDFLKLVAILSMLIDHIGGIFFPEVGIFRWIGRLAFPLFCYCMTVGLLYTKDSKRYLGRLLLFAVISQPFYVLAFHHDDWMTEWSNWNIFSTLFISLLAMVGLKERKWWLFILSFLAASFFSFDYSANGIILMLIFFLCRNHPKLGALLFVLDYIGCLWNGSVEDPLALVVGGHAVDWLIFSLLAAPLIFLRTNTHLKVPKWFFYAFYPAHLAVLGLIQFF